MIYEKHKLFENINNIKGTKDMRISRELIVSELAKVILSRPHEVKRASSWRFAVQFAVREPVEPLLLFFVVQ